MEPLSCVNCCHNPLQLGLIGTAFGHCTRHRVVLIRPHLTTCGQLLRKDLLIESAERERVLHSGVYRENRVSLVMNPDAPATKLVERSNGQMPTDAVFEEVQAYGTVDQKIGTMAALHRIAGPRAEVAMLSLSRAYVANCFRRDRKWKSGVHLLHWTLQKLDEEPIFSPTDLRGPLAFSLAQTNAIAKWTLIMFRLGLVADVAAYASKSQDPVGRLRRFAISASAIAPPTDPEKLLMWLSAKKSSWSRPLSQARYARLREELHKEEERAATAR
jgi:hypothetical protein